MNTRFLAMLSCTILVLVSGVSADAITLSISDVEGEAGSTVQALINIDSDVEAVGSMDITLDYDKDLLTAKELTSSDALAGGFSVLPNLTKEGKVIIGGISKDPFVGSTVTAGLLFTIAFEVNATAAAGSESPLTLVEASLANVDGDEISLEVTDGEFTVSGQPPELAEIGNQQVDEGQTLEFTVSAVDPDGDALTFSATDLPQGSTFENGVFSWVPNSEQAGPYSVTFAVDDGKGGTDSETITITVEDVEELLPAIREHTKDSQMLALEVDFSNEGVAKCYVDVWQGEVTIEAGQYLEYQIAMFTPLPAYCAGIDLHTKDGTFLSATDAKDQFGLSASPQTDLSVSIKDGDTDIKHAARDRWYHRQISLEALVGKTLDRVIFATVCEEHEVGLFRSYVDNIQITNGTGEDAGRVLDIYIDGDGQKATESEFATNENVNNSTVTFGEVTIGVHPAGKLPITWGKIKKLY